MTEAQIATEGATEDDRVGNKVWTLGRLSPTSGDNMNEVMNATRLGKGYIDYHIAYGSIVLDSPQEQNTWMYAGSDDNHKVWLNGALVHEQLNWYWAHDYQESFQVTLKKGKNVLLVAVEDGAGAWSGFFGFEKDAVYTILPLIRREDVNQDGRVSIADIVTVAQNLRKPVSEKPRADVNGDGKISLADLVSVASYIAKVRSGTAAAPGHQEVRLDAATVQTWLRLARIEDDGSLIFREGIANLERLLASLVPKETVLLANYPNPFNPETWIPYRLATPADVSVEIHAANGTLVRRLVLGALPAGMYADKSRAAYWDGKNEVGEPVASGVYFYTLTADDFSATRKMLIRK